VLSRKPRIQTAATSHQPDLRASHAEERKHLLAVQAAGYTALRRSNHGITSRARAEIAVAFAHRWAEIRRLAPALRAVAAAALEAEQAAALSARTRYLSGELHAQSRTDRTQLRYLYATQRKALTTRHRQASVSAERSQQGRTCTRPAAA
jgi:hypothetical protein